MTTDPTTSRWSAPATAFDAWFDSPWGRHAADVEHRMLLDAAGDLEGRVVLDVGCGTGRLLLRLREVAGQVAGIDRDPDAISLAAARLPGSVVVGDARALPVADDAADVTIASTVCEFAGDPERLVAELARATRPGGRVVIGLLARSSPWGWWNRRQFDHPPWDTARFLDPDELARSARVHGTCTLRSGLFAPRHLPLVERWSPLLEGAGRLLAPRHGAFVVLTIRVHDRRPIFT